MSKYSAALSLGLLLVILIGCSSSEKIAALKPEPDDAVPLVYQNAPSYINIPVSIKLKDIENQTNNLLQGLIYEDNSIEDDDIEMKIWKLAPITLANDQSKVGNRITTILPLKATIKYRVGTKRLGISIYDVKEFNLNGVVTLSSEVSLANWKLGTKTALKSLDWKESPTMDVFGKKMPVTYLVNPAVSLFKSKIEKNIDSAIEKSMDFKPNVLNALEKLCVPMLMNEEYKSWLRISPMEIYSTEAKLINDNILLQLGMKCTMETLIGNKPESKFDGQQITLKTVSKIPSALSVNMLAVSTYQDASKIMTANFARQEFSSGKQKVKVENVAIWQKKGKLIIELKVLGSVNGTIYLTGLPKFKAETKELYFDELDYALDTKSKLMRTANWLTQGIILKKFQESCRYSLAPNLREGKASMMRYLTNYSPIPGVVINGKMSDIQFQKMELTNQAIIAFVKIEGTVNIVVNGLK